MEDLWQSPPCVSVFVQLPCGVSPTYHGTQAESIVYAICFAPQPSSIKIHVFLLLGKAVSCAVLRPTLSTYEWALSLEYFLTNRVLTVYVQLIIFCGNTFPHFRLCSAQVCESYKPDQHTTIPVPWRQSMGSFYYSTRRVHTGHLSYSGCWGSDAYCRSWFYSVFQLWD